MNQPGFVADAAQQQSIALLDQLFDLVVNQRSRSGWRSWFGRREQRVQIRGLYLWGGVGRGKTLLMDMFYQSLPDHIESRRTHFHSFMNQIHAALRQKKNVENPLREIAEDIAATTRVLCLDEFVIIDISHT